LLAYPINNNTTGLTSEWIVEEASTSCPDLSFTNVAFAYCYTYGTTLSTYLDVAFNYRRDDLYDYTKTPHLLVAQPPPLGQSYDPPHGFPLTGSDPPN
jgi:hypothetical protein